MTPVTSSSETHCISTCNKNTNNMKTFYTFLLYEQCRVNIGAKRAFAPARWKIFRVAYFTNSHCNIVL